MAPIRVPIGLLRSGMRYKPVSPSILVASTYVLRQTLGTTSRQKTLPARVSNNKYEILVEHWGDEPGIDNPFDVFKEVGTDLN